MVGTENGKIIEYDLRYPLPIRTFTHHYRMPIKNIKFHKSGKLLTADRKIIKIWDRNGDLFTNIEPKAEINDIEIANDGTGIVYCPME